MYYSEMGVLVGYSLCACDDGMGVCADLCGSWGFRLVVRSPSLMQIVRFVLSFIMLAERYIAVYGMVGSGDASRGIKGPTHADKSKLALLEIYETKY